MPTIGGTFLSSETKSKRDFLNTIPSYAKLSLLKVTIPQDLIFMNIAVRTSALWKCN